jgi:hypothetical protein
MSRYRIPADDPHYDVIVGWDDPLETYFTTVFDTTVDADDAAACILWEGAALRALPTVEALQDRLCAYATIPPEVVVQLQQDGATPTPRTPLQERMVQVLTPRV